MPFRRRAHARAAWKAESSDVSWLYLHKTLANVIASHHADKGGRNHRKAFHDILGWHHGAVPKESGETFSCLIVTMSKIGHVKSRHCCALVRNRPQDTGSVFIGQRVILRDRPAEGNATADSEVRACWTGAKFRAMKATSVCTTRSVSCILAAATRSACRASQCAGVLRGPV